MPKLCVIFFKKIKTLKSMSVSQEHNVFQNAGFLKNVQS